MNIPQVTRMSPFDEYLLCFLIKIIVQAHCTYLSVSGSIFWTVPQDRS